MADGRTPHQLCLYGSATSKAYWPEVRHLADGVTKHKHHGCVVRPRAVIQFNSASETHLLGYAVHHGRSAGKNLSPELELPRSEHEGRP